MNEKIDLLCMQETDINKNLDHNLLSFPGYSIEMENNSGCSRVAVYESKRVKYIRRKDLEGVDSNIIMMGSSKLRIIMYDRVLWNDK